MDCFNHSGQNAAALCRGCLKGLCHGCSHPLERGSVCSDLCKKEVTEVDKVIDLNKKIYGIGVERNKFSYIFSYNNLMGLFFISLGLLFSANPILNYKNFNFLSYTNYFEIFLGFSFIVGGIKAFLWNKY